MVSSPLIQTFPSPEDSAAAAIALGRMLTAGDTILLSGEVGAGKTHFARALIQSLLTQVEDVPSPTFTLVQVYDTLAGAIWHADLYRLGDIGEVEELGLTEAFETSICLIEWPDRLGDAAPSDALSLHLTDGADENARITKAFWHDDKWQQKLAAWEVMV